jgi:type 1 glutamine amidotransferase
MIWRVLAAGVCLALAQPAALGKATPDATPAARAAGAQGAGAKRKVVFVAGRRSHAYGSHDHWAGSLLLAKWLNENHPQIEGVVQRDGWPADPGAFDNAAAVVIYADGGGGHPAVKHLDQLGALMKQGVGLVLLHYAVEVQEAAAGRQFLDWAGGYFKINWSVNPHWLLQVKSLPKHPITQGVQPFAAHDEWYYHMQFREGLKGVTPILTALPPASTLVMPDGTLARNEGAHENNPAVRAAVLERKEPQHVAWAVERADGGRSFSFTGGHWHWNWGHPMQRKLVLNAIAWAAKADVPATGIETPRVTIEDLEANNEEDPSRAWLGLPPLPRGGQGGQGSQQAQAGGPQRQGSDQARAGGSGRQGARRGGRGGGGGNGAETPTRTMMIERLDRWHKEYPPRQ